MAVASAFEIPIYFNAKKPGSEYFVWNVVQPFTSTNKALKLPVFPGINKHILLLMPAHLDLLYYNSLHYMPYIVSKIQKRYV